MNYKTILSELDRELTMRRSVWRGFGEGKEKFANMQHQRQYDALKYLRNVLSSAGETAFSCLVSKVKTDLPQTQQFLF